MRLDQGQVGASECVSKNLDYALHQSKLLVERSQHLFARDWGDFAKYYVEGYRVLHLRVNVTGAESVRGEQGFSFLIGAEEVTVTPYSEGAARRPTREKQSSAGELTGMQDEAWKDLHQALPMLIFVGDLVHCPEQIVSSRVWFLGEDQSPLVGREFLFQSVMPGGWKRFRLPIRAGTPEGEPYARNAATIGLDQRDNHFIQSRTEMADSLHDFPRHVFRGQALDAANYVASLTVKLTANGAIHTVDGPFIQHSFNVVELSLSTADLFQ